MLFYMSYFFFGLPIVSCSLMIIVWYQDACDFWHLFKTTLWYYVFGVLQSLTSLDVSVPGPSFRISDSTWCHRTPLCHNKLLNLDILQGSFRLCNWLSLWRLVSWINHLPPACWSTLWKSIFKHQLGCRFDILDSISFFISSFLYFEICNYICLDPSYYILALSLLLKYSLFFQLLMY